jgi:hypothetical protein
MQFFDEDFLAAQMEIVQRERAFKGQQQVAQWKLAAGPAGLVDPKFRFVALLEEGYRHEVKTIRSGTTSRPHAVSDLDLLVDDIKASYSRLIPEARRLFDERKDHGLSVEELGVVSTQATSSFASMYPWSDGVTCRDLTISHRHFVPLATHNMITAGSSGIVTIKSFIASMPCAEMKQEAAMARRQARIEEYHRQREENAAAAAALKDQADSASFTPVKQEQLITVATSDSSIEQQLCSTPSGESWQSVYVKKDPLLPTNTTSTRVKPGRIAGASCGVNNRSPGRRNNRNSSRRSDRVHITL